MYIHVYVDYVYSYYYMSIYCDYKCMKLTCAASTAAFISLLVAQGTRDIISLVAYRNKQT